MGEAAAAKTGRWRQRGRRDGRYDWRGRVLQMVCLQALYYAAAATVALLVAAPSRGDLALVPLLAPSSVAVAAGRAAVGTAVSYAVAAAAVAAAMPAVVEKSRECWDFAATVVAAHALLCTCCCGPHFGYPLWWLLMAASFATMTLLGRNLCLRRELAAIPLRFTRSTAAPAADLHEVPLSHPV